MFYLYVTVVALLDAGAIISAKFWQNTRQSIYLVITIVAFAIAGYFFARSLQYQGIALTNIIWSALSTIFITLAGYFLFRENITALQFFGIAVIIIGLILVNIR